MTAYEIIKQWCQDCKFPEPCKIEVNFLLEKLDLREDHQYSYIHTTAMKALWS